MATNCLPTQATAVGGALTPCVEKNNRPGHQTFDEFGRDNISVFIILVIVALLILIVWYFDRRWRRKQAELERVTGVMNQSYAFSLNLVRHFMPSFKVERYQFRGMQVKKDTVSIKFKDLSLELRSGQRVLHGVTEEFQAGRMCAIMGPSGAGKTTFMNALCGKATYGKVGGSVFINEQEAEVAEVKSITGFVPQDDIVHENLTVREQIQFSAQLRNSAQITGEQIERIVEDVLHVMQIDHVQNSIVGGVERRGISGGQRKRVNIGLELAAQPTLLFLDEPTSGLDSTSSLSVCLSLKKMCQLGMTSIMVIHQPRYSLFTLFDEVLLLGKGGQTVYVGPSLGAKPYFESLGFQMPANENPADWFMDIISGEVTTSQIDNFRPEMLFKLWEDRDQRPAYISEDLSSDSRARFASSEDDRAILSHKLTEEWERIDANHSGVVEEGELSTILANCSFLAPSAEVVHELMQRMAGEGATNVTKAQFLDYLCSLQGAVACDRTLTSLDEQGLLGPHRRSHSRVQPEAGGDSMDKASADLESGGSTQHTWGSVATVDELQRGLPGPLRQLRLIVARRHVQWWRMNPQRAIFLAAMALGALFLAIQDSFLIDAPLWAAPPYLNMHTALALLLSIFCVQVFGSDQPVFWRERARGLNVLAFFQGRLLMDSLDVVIHTFTFVLVFYAIRQPMVPFLRFIVPFLCTAYAASGWGYLVSTVVPPRHGPFIVALVVFILCGLLGSPTNLDIFLNGGLMQVVLDILCITRWTVAMSFYDFINSWEPVACGQEAAELTLYKKVYLENTWNQAGTGVYWTSVVAISIIGTALRLATLLGLLLMNRSRVV